MGLQRPCNLKASAHKPRERMTCPPGSAPLQERRRRPRPRRPPVPFRLNLHSLIAIHFSRSVANSFQKYRNEYINKLHEHREREQQIWPQPVPRASSSSCILGPCALRDKLKPYFLSVWDIELALPMVTARPKLILLDWAAVVETEKE